MYKFKKYIPKQNSENYLKIKNICDIFITAIRDMVIDSVDLYILFHNYSVHFNLQINRK